MRRTLGRVLGTRHLQTTGSRRRAVTVRLGAPRQRAPDEWFCPIQVSGLRASKVQYVHAEDAIQAVELALQAIRVALDKSDNLLTWLGGEPGVTGFPRSVPYGLCFSFSRRLDRLIDREVSRFVRELERRHRARQRRRAGLAAPQTRGKKVVKLTYALDARGPKGK